MARDTLWSIMLKCRAVVACWLICAWIVASQGNKDAGPSQQPNFRGDGLEEIHAGPDGFRFLLAMAAVRFGYGNEEQ